MARPILFSIRVFFHRHRRFKIQQGKGQDHLFFHSATSTRSLTFRHLFATLYMRWLSLVLIAPLVFTRLLLDKIYHFIELPFDWLIMQCFFVLLTWWFGSRLVLQQFHMGNRWIWTYSDYQHCIKSEPTNQVC